MSDEPIRPDKQVLGPWATFWENQPVQKMENALRDRMSPAERVSELFEAASSLLDDIHAGDCNIDGGLSSVRRLERVLAAFQGYEAPAVRPEGTPAPPVSGTPAP